MIDLSRLNQVTPSEDLSSVTVGPGNRWGQVYSKLDSLGIAIGGGRVATVGVGGLTLGGRLRSVKQLIGSQKPTDSSTQAASLFSRPDMGSFATMSSGLR